MPLLRRARVVERGEVNQNAQALAAYLGTLLAIVLLTLAAALIVILGNIATAEGIAKVIGALGFIGSAVTGLIGVIGTFRPKGPATASTESGDVNLNEGTNE